MKAKQEKYSFIGSLETQKKVESYLNDLQLGTVKPGRFLRDLLILQMKTVRNISPEELLECLIQTKIDSMLTKKINIHPDLNWNECELKLLCDISCSISTVTYEDGNSEQPKIYEEPLPLTCIYVPTPLLLPKHKPEIALVSSDGAFNFRDYYQLLKNRILPSLLHANQLAKDANKTLFITMPAIGCFQFTGKNKSVLSMHFYTVLKQLLSEHHSQLTHIKGLMFDTLEVLPLSDSRIGHIDFLYRSSLNSGLAPLSHPSAYGTSYASCELVRFVDYDSIFRPGNRWAFELQQGLDRLTGIMPALTGFEGLYLPLFHQIVPKEAPDKTWLDYIASKGGAWLKLVNNIHYYSINKPTKKLFSTYQDKLKEGPEDKLEEVLETIKNKSIDFYKIAVDLYDSNEPHNQSKAQIKYKNASHAAFYLHFKVNTAYQQYKMDKDKQKFLAAVTPAIRWARKSELKNHRGFKEILGQGGLLILAIGSVVGLIYLVGRYAYQRQSFFPVNFKTDSIQQIEKLESEITRLINSP